MVRDAQFSMLNSFMQRLELQEIYHKAFEILDCEHLHFRRRGSFIHFGVD
jgi:hypothetical protein